MTDKDALRRTIHLLEDRLTFADNEIKKQHPAHMLTLYLREGMAEDREAMEWVRAIHAGLEVKDRVCSDTRNFQKRLAAVRRCLKLRKELQVLKRSAVKAPRVHSTWEAERAYVREHERRKRMICGMQKLRAEVQVLRLKLAAQQEPDNYSRSVKDWEKIVRNLAEELKKSQDERTKTALMLLGANDRIAEQISEAKEKEAELQDLRTSHSREASLERALTNAHDDLKVVKQHEEWLRGELKTCQEANTRLIEERNNAEAHAKRLETACRKHRADATKLKNERDALVEELEWRRKQGQSRQLPGDTICGTFGKSE